MNVKLTLPIAAVLAVGSVLAGGGGAGSVATNAAATSCYVSRLTALPVAASAGSAAAHGVPVWRPGC